MNRLQLVTEVRRRLGEDTADFWDANDVILALDHAVQRFSHEFDWSWLQSVTTVAVAVDATTLTLPADIDASRIVATKFTPTDGTSQPFKKVTPADGFRLQSVHTSTGRPRWYYVYTTAPTGGPPASTFTTTLRMIPTSNVAGDVDLLYYRRPAALTADTQEPDVPEDHQAALIAHATAKLWLHELDASGVKAGEQMSLYADEVTKAILQETKLGDDETLALGMADDEREQSGVFAPFQLPDNYGIPTGDW